MNDNQYRLFMYLITQQDFRSKKAVISYTSRFRSQNATHPPPHPILPPPTPPNPLPTWTTEIIMLVI